MPNLDFFLIKLFTNGPFQLVAGLKGTPFQRLVNKQDLSIEKVLRGFHKVKTVCKLTENAPSYGNQAHNEAVDGKIGQFALADQFYHPSTGGKSSNKSSGKTCAHGNGLVAYEVHITTQKVFGHFP